MRIGAPFSFSKIYSIFFNVYKNSPHKSFVYERLWILTYFVGKMGPQRNCAVCQNDVHNSSVGLSPTKCSQKIHGSE